jgi:Arc-like DNA binding domain
MAEDYPSRELDQFLLRLPDGMRDQIAAAAKANNRTMTAEIVSCLQNHFDAQKKQRVSFLDTPVPQFVHKDALAEVAEALANLRQSVEKRFDRLEKGLHTPPRVPKDVLWPDSKAKSKKS